MKESKEVASAKVLATPASVVWQTARYYPLDDMDSDVKFSDRLARENLWSKEFTDRVIMEYKKFMFLAIVSKDPVTPSLEVDEAWHLHLLYTREYEKFCHALRSGYVHHGPTKGGKKEDDKFVDWYEKTKTDYMIWFDEKPPTDIWPPSPIRFRPVHFARVDLMKHWVVPSGDIKGLLKCVWQYCKWKIKRIL